MSKLTIPLVTIFQSDRYTIELLGGTAAIIWDKKFQKEQRIDLKGMYPKEWSVYQLKNGVSHLVTTRYLELSTFKEYVEFFKVPCLVDELIVYYEFVYAETLEVGTMEMLS